MPLSIGTRLGLYEILAPLGAGGMGEVYRARDTKLNRDVALKILPELFASDHDRLARFAREAQALAALNHPNIAQVYGLEDRAIVMELVEGETLDGLIAGQWSPGASAPGTSISDALAIARQIAEALEAAHNAGIVHRDLKPANIKVRPDGTVKVLDFGLAKAVEGDGSRPGDPSPWNSPTLTARATEMGMILGTAAYMAPEQARGKAVDRRADVWAFGVVLLELLIGRRAFTGGDVTDVLAAVIRDAPPLEALPPGTPVAIRRLLRRCLEKDRAKRLDSMADARLEIADALDGISDGTPAASAGAVAPAGPAAPLWRRAPFLVLAAVVLVAASALATAVLTPAPPAEPVTRVAVNADADTQGFDNNGIALSPGGGMLVYPLRDEGGSRLYLRRRDQLQATVIPGTEGGMGPFFSPDGLWVGFFTGAALKKVNLSGGEPVTLCDVGFRRGAAWGHDGSIVFSSGSSPGLMVVPEAGGEPVALTTPAPGEGEHYWPSVLPGGRGVLYTVSTGNAFSQKHVAVLSQSTGESQQLVQGTTPVYLSSGYIVFGRESSLWAARFDLDSLRMTTEPVPVVEDVQINAGGGWGQFAVSLAGALAYQPGSTTQLQPVLIDGDSQTPMANEGHVFDEFRVSPDGTQLVLEAEGDVWVLEIARGVFTRITTSGGFDPLWLPDGSAITAVTADGVSKFPPDGSGGGEVVVPLDAVVWMGSWSPDGTTLAYESQSDIWLWSADGGSKPWLDAPSRQGKPEFSPDGRWLAYISDETGTTNVYVRPFPGPGGQRRVSAPTGSEPAWARDGRTLFFRQGTDLMSVGFDPASGPLSARPERVFQGAQHMISATGTNRYYDVTPADRGFVVLVAPARAEGVHVVYNWIRELTAIVGG